VIGTWRTALSLCVVAVAGVVWPSGRVHAGSAEVKLDRDYLARLVEKMPPLPIHSEQARGSVHGYRLVAIDARTRRFLVGCQVDGEFRPTIAGPIARRASRDGAGDVAPDDGPWRKFRFEVQVAINVEPGKDGSPRFRIAVDEVRRKELEGIAGALARLLGKYFDDMVTRVAAGKASQMSDKLNAEVVKRVSAFKEYGVFSGIDYAPTQVVLHFEMTRFRSEGVAGYLFPVSSGAPPPGTVPLIRAVNPKLGAHLYTTNPIEAESNGFHREGIAGHVHAHPAPGSVPFYRWRSRRDLFYTTARDGEGSYRMGYRGEGVSCFLYADAKPGTVPFYRFVDPRTGHHFYTVHPHAEFAR
jgi:hypothetical protein